MLFKRHPSHSSMLSQAWPAFVDLLAATLLAILFVFLLFIALEIHLADTLSHREKAVALLSEERTLLKKQLKKAKARQAHLRGIKEALAHQFEQSQLALKVQEDMTKKATSELDALTQEKLLLQKVIKDLELAVDLSQEKISVQKTTIEHLNQKLKDALYRRVQELEGYRSEFLANLKKTLQGKKGFIVSGDRFIFQSEILFPLGSDQLQPKGQKELLRFAHLLKDLLKKIPTSFPLILRIDGHTDKLPIKEKKHFESNLDLSFARAKAVAHFLAKQGIPKARLVPTGFAENYPLDGGDTPAALARNRRIEFKLDQR